MNPKSWAWPAAFAATLVAATAAYAPGGIAYTKRVETVLLAEPQMLAPAVGRVGYARRLNVDEVKGAWVRASDGKLAGWVFGGNLVEQKPSETPGLDGLPFAASQASATAAARPLVPASEDYSNRHGLAKAADDLVWLAGQQASLPADAVQAYLKEQKKGEFQ